MDGKHDMLWAFLDIRINFPFYNHRNMYKLNLSFKDKFKLYRDATLSIPYYFLNYDREKFILLPTFLTSMLVTNKRLPKRRTFVLCGGGYIYIGHKTMDNYIKIKIDTSFLPPGLSFFSIDDEVLYLSLWGRMNGPTIKDLINDYHKHGDRAALEWIFRLMTETLAKDALEYLSIKVKY